MLRRAQRTRVPGVIYDQKPVSWNRNLLRQTSRNNSMSLQSATLQNKLL